MSDFDNQKWDEVLDKLRKELTDIEIPESLQPEHMMENIEKKSKERVITMRHRRRQIITTVVSLAACFSICMYAKDFMPKLQYRDAEQTEKKQNKDTDNEVKQEESSKVEEPTTDKQVDDSNQNNDDGNTYDHNDGNTGQSGTTGNSKKEEESKPVEKKEKEEADKTKEEVIRDSIPVAESYKVLYNKINREDIVMNSYGVGEMAEVDGDISGSSGISNDVTGSTGDSASVDDSSEEQEASMAQSSTATSVSLDGTTVETDDYSKTNTVEANIDEADIVKTDGKYIYALSKKEECIRIVKVTNKMKLCQEVMIDSSAYEQMSIEDMYVIEDKMVVISQVKRVREDDKQTNEKSITDSETTDESDATAETVGNAETAENGNATAEAAVDIAVSTTEDIAYTDDVSTNVVYQAGQYDTVMDVYDISSRNAVKHITTNKQSGAYESSRYSDGYLYVFSEQSAFCCMEEYDKKTFKNTVIPKINDTCIKPGNIYLVEDEEQLYNRNFSVISSWNLNNPKKCVDAKSILGRIDNLYVSETAIYTAVRADSSRQVFEDMYLYESRTKVFKFDYVDGSILYRTKHIVSGYLNDSFAMSEKDGYLRIVAYVDDYNGFNWVNYSNFYVLDANMKSVGLITKIAEGEELHAVRYLGDKAYFVTYETVDPLFTVDVSNPEDPKIIGELKIPGYSSYLHVWSENMLLGIGYEDNYIKLSMFDITDPSNVKEVASKVVDKGYSNYSSSMSNYKELCISGEKNVIGMQIVSEGEYNTYYEYFTFGYDENNGFYERAITSLGTNAGQEIDVRGLYIGKYFYVVKPNAKIIKYSLKDFSKTDKLDF